MKINTFFNALKYLESHIPNTLTTHKTLRLERIGYLCKLLGDPQKKYPIIHITGTSGKGSTAIFCASLLTNLGLKTGLHISPHLQSITERFQINNRPISETHFLKLLNEILPFIERVDKETNFGYPTYFEILVALCFYYNAQEKVDAVVVEVGLGGKLDGTNIIPPSLAVLTNVSLDHTEILGNTIEEIVQDKMQIVKIGAPACVSGLTQASVIKLLENYCQKLQVPLYLLNRDFSIYRGKLKALGDFQKLNFSLSVKAIELFIQKYYANKFNLLTQAIEKTAQTVTIPGRLEIIQNNPLIILDGAHNPAKMKALVDSIKHIYPGKKFISIVAVKQKKDYQEMLKILDKITYKYLFTNYNQTNCAGIINSYAAENLSHATRLKKEVISVSSQAIDRVLIINKQYKLPILITGSLYLVGEVRGRWKN